MSSVFISYSTRNSRDAHAVRDALIKADITYWIAPDCIAPGEEYPDAIATAMRACDRVVLLVSKASMASAMVRREIELAATHKKRILPVLLEQVEIRGGLEYLIAGAQLIDGTPTDPEAWTQDVVAAVHSGAGVEAAQVPQRRGFLTLDIPTMAFIAAGITACLAFFVSLVSGTTVAETDQGSLFTSPLGLISGFLVLAALAYGARYIAQKRGKQIVVRIGDVLALTGLLIGLLLFTGAFLFTPFLAALAVVAIYATKRSLWLKRWGVTAAALVIGLGTAVWILEGQFYRHVIGSGETVALVPNCAEFGCAPEGRPLYVSLVTELNGLLTGAGPSLLPTDRSSSYSAYFDNAGDFRERPLRAHRMNVLSNWRDFDSLAYISLEPADCGAPKLRFELEVRPVHRRAPIWSRWQLGTVTPLAGERSLEGYLPLEEESPAALLLAGLILQYVLEIGTDHPDLLQQYLLTARQTSYRPYLTDLSDADLARLTARDLSQRSAPEMASLLEAVVIALTEYAARIQDDQADACEAASTNAMAQLIVRNGAADWNQDRD